MIRGYFKYLITLSCIVSFSVFGLVESQLSTSFGKSFDKTSSDASLSFLPEMRLLLDEEWFFDFGVLVDRPFKAEENFSVPKVGLSFSHQIKPFGLNGRAILGATLYELHRLGQEEYKCRPSLGLEVTYEPIQSVSILFRVAPYIQFNRYHQNVDGSENARYGATERVYLSYRTGRTTFEARLILEQRHSVLWNNDYITYEHIQYDLTDKTSIGLSHELISSRVDSTGFYSPVRFFDGRESRVSVFLETGL